MTAVTAAAMISTGIQKFPFTIVLRDHYHMCNFPLAAMLGITVDFVLPMYMNILNIIFIYLHLNEL